MSFLKNLASWGQSPSKSANGESSANTMQQSGIKRKIDPYDDLPQEEELTPTTRRARSRVSSEVPSGSKPRLSAGTNKRRSRSLTKRPYPVAQNNHPTSSPRELSAMQSNGDDDASAENRNSSVPITEMGAAGPPKKADDANITPDAAKPVETDAEKVLVTALEKGRNDGADGEHEVERLIKHRQLSDSTVEILVKWVGEREEDATYETEHEIQTGAAETLYEYWNSLGGRTQALFYNGKNPYPETYHAFKILRHKKQKTVFEFEVQWVGYPATADDTTWEAEVKLKKIAPQMLDEYWESKGGRARFLAKRGRAKKARTE